MKRLFLSVTPPNIIVVQKYTRKKERETAGNLRDYEIIQATQQQSIQM